MLAAAPAANLPPVCAHCEAALAGASKVKSFPREPSREALKWADKELRRMSLEEKIGQLISVAVNATFLNQDSDAYRALKHQVEDNHVGGIILFRSPVYESVVLINRLQQIARYPLLISADLEAGAGMRFDDTVNFPWNMAVAATGKSGLCTPSGGGYGSRGARNRRLSNLRASCRCQQQCCQPGNKCSFLWRRPG
jgi:glycosyl hydrolase family 3